MQIRVTPDLEARLVELSAKTGRATDELVEDALTAYLGELAALRETLDSRFDDFRSGLIQPVDGETFFEALREREEPMGLPRSE